MNSRRYSIKNAALISGGTGLFNSLPPFRLNIKETRATWMGSLPYFICFLTKENKAIIIACLSNDCTFAPYQNRL